MNDVKTVETAVRGSGIPPGARIVVAVSGGPDSVALLAALAAAGEKLGWTLTVAHVNHGLREEATTDERFVRALARELGLPCRVRRVDTGKFARQHGLSTEAAARSLRYDALRDVMRRARAELIATGHTMDDQAESIMLHLLRGAGLDGMGGMWPLRGAIVRPLLGVRRDEVLSYLQRRNLGYRLDASNLDPRHLRNRVRMEVLPALERLQPRGVETLARAGRLLQLDAAYLREEVERALRGAGLQAAGDERRVSRAVVRCLHPALQRAMVRALLGEGEQTLDISADHVEAILELVSSPPASGRGSVTLPGGRRCLIENGYLAVRTQTEPDIVPLPEVALRIPGAVQTPAGALTARLAMLAGEELRRQIVVAGPFHAWCDAGRLGTELRVRSRRPGDRLRPLGLGGSKKLQDLFVDGKVPVRERDRIPVVAAGGAIVWVPGFALDEGYAARDLERPVVHLEFRPTLAYQGATIQRHF